MVGTALRLKLDRPTCLDGLLRGVEDFVDADVQLRRDGVFYRLIVSDAPNEIGDGARGLVLDGLQRDRLTHRVRRVGSSAGGARETAPSANWPNQSWLRRFRGSRGIFEHHVDEAEDRR